MRLRGRLGAVEWVTSVDITRLHDADASYEPTAEHRYPEGDDVVYVLGENGPHAILAKVRPGQQLAFQGRVYETKTGGAAGELHIRFTGITTNRVTNTFRRRTDTLIDLTVRYQGSGREETLSGTPEHPFFVPAAGGYVALGKLEPGTVLSTQDGSEARVIASRTRHGDFEVFNLEVEHAHNYFVSAPGSNGPGVLVHNTCTFTTRTSPTGVSTGIRDTTLNGRKYSVNSDHAWSRGHKSGRPPSSTGMSKDSIENALIKDLDGFMQRGVTAQAC
jgi:hypothetical protein